MYVCMCVCMYVHVSKHACIHVCMNSGLRAHMHEGTCIYMYRIFMHITYMHEVKYMYHGKRVPRDGPV